MIGLSQAAYSAAAGNQVESRDKCTTEHLLNEATISYEQMRTSAARLEATLDRLSGPTASGELGVASAQMVPQAQIVGLVPRMSDFARHLSELNDRLQMICSRFENHI